jgi:hypothetical protein
MYGLKLERRILDENLFELDTSNIHDNYYSQTLLLNWYNNRLLPLVRQFFLIQIELMSLWISDRKISSPV